MINFLLIYVITLNIEALAYIVFYFGLTFSSRCNCDFVVT